MSINKKITVEVLVESPLKKAWDGFTNPEAVTRWNFASDDWKCPRAQNDLRVGGTFNYRMESADGKFGFDFEGIYRKVDLQKCLEFSLGDREVRVEFLPEGSRTRVVERFDPEGENSLELQRQGWQAILDNYKKYLENS